MLKKKNISQRLKNQFTNFLQAKWVHAMKEDPAVQKHMLSTFVHTKFSMARRAGTPNYDILDEINEEE